MYDKNCDAVLRDQGADQDGNSNPLFSSIPKAKAGRVGRQSKVETNETQGKVHKGLGQKMKSKQIQKR